MVTPLMFEPKRSVAARRQLVLGTLRSPHIARALADALAETLGDVWARLGLALKHWAAGAE